MTDPKHLPPRDCMVLTDEFFTSPTWVHVRYAGDEKREWWEPYGLVAIDPERVIDFREMDVMG